MTLPHDQARTLVHRLDEIRGDWWETADEGVSGVVQVTMRFRTKGGSPGAMQHIVSDDDSLDHLLLELVEHNGGLEDGAVLLSIDLACLMPRAAIAGVTTYGWGPSEEDPDREGQTRFTTDNFWTRPTQ